MNGYKQHFEKLRNEPNSGDRRAMTPEEIVRNHLKERLGQKKKSVKRVQSDRPVAAIGFLLAVGFSLGAIAYLDMELVEDTVADVMKAARVVQVPKIQLQLFGLGMAADAKSSLSSSSQGLQGKEAAAKSSGSTSDGSAKTATPENSAADQSADQQSQTQIDPSRLSAEELKFFKNLIARKEQLDRREVEIGKLEEELQKSRLEIEERIKELEALRSQISKTLEDRVKHDQEKVVKLVDVYSNMKPAQAAKVIESLNEDLAMDVLERMKKKSAADILNAMSSEKAKRLSEMMAGYEKSRSRGPSTAQAGD